MMTDEELQKLEAAAKAATQPGPWAIKKSMNAGVVNFAVLDANGMWVADVGNVKSEAAHIAAFNPLVAGQLLAHIRELRAALAMLCDLSEGFLGADHDDCVGEIRVHFSDRPSMYLRTALAKECDKARHLLGGGQEAK
jgi:hypothetical protein